MSNAMLQEMKIPAPEFRGGNFALGACRDLEVCLDGPAGTGKTYAALYKIHLLLTLYPGARALVARKTNTALSGSAMVTYREDILRPEENVRYFGGNRIRPAAFLYPNGSELVINGLDKAEKVKSTAFDIALINEATEVTLEDWEFVRSRLRHGKLPYHQLIADVNPVEPTHWLNCRMNDGLTTRLLSQHEDNPRYFDLKTMTWTPDGYNYIEVVLGGLTGVRLARLRYGMWAAAEGSVYQDSWNRAVNVVDRFTIPLTWSRWLCIDFGYTNPFVCQWYAMDPDGRLYMYRELYQTKLLVEDAAEAIAIASGWFHLLPRTHERYNNRPADWSDPLPREIICDHDIEDRRTLERHLGLYTVAAKKSVTDGIQAVSVRWRVAGDGKPRLMLFRDALIAKDPDLAARKKPTCTAEEIDGYVFQVNSAGVKEEPVKIDDHGCLVAGTLVTTRKGDIPIEQIAKGDYVLTRNGYKPVIASGMTQRNAEVYTVTLSNGTTLTGTGNHPVYLNKHGYTPLRSLRYSDIMVNSQSYQERYSPLCQSLQHSASKRLSTRISSSGVTPIPSIGQTPTTIDPIQDTSRRALSPFIKRSGKMLTALFQMGAIFTTRTATRLTTRPTIWNASHPKNTAHIMAHCSLLNSGKPYVTAWKTLDPSLPHGTNQKLGESGTAFLVASRGKQRSTKRITANSVEPNSNHALCSTTTLAIVPTTASLQRGVNLGWTTSNVPAPFAKERLSLTNTCSPASVLSSAQISGVTQNQGMKRCNALSVKSYLQSTNQQNGNAVHEDVQTPFVVSVEKSSNKQDVYNLTVDNAVGEGEFFANGILVHNCDVVRYMVAYHDLAANGVSYFPDIWT